MLCAQLLVSGWTDCRYFGQEGGQYGRLACSQKWLCPTKGKMIEWVTAGYWILRPSVIEMSLLFKNSIGATTLEKQALIVTKVQFPACDQWTWAPIRLPHTSGGSTLIHRPSTLLQTSHLLNTPAHHPMPQHHGAHKTTTFSFPDIAAMRNESQCCLRWGWKLFASSC